MCLICAHLDNKTLTPWEAARNRREYLDVLDEEHLKELDEKIRLATYNYLNNLDSGEKDEIQH